jgi:hypothetical protein
MLSAHCSRRPYRKHPNLLIRREQSRSLAVDVAVRRRSDHMRRRTRMKVVYPAGQAHFAAKEIGVCADL